MFKKKLICLLLLITVYCIQGFAGEIRKFAEISPIDNMPILEKRGKETTTFGYPIEQRGAEYRKYLAASVKISVSGSSGSGTIIYYDASKNIAYVASCGHLWSRGVMSAEDGRRRNMRCRIIAYYHNNEKLNSPKSYDANVIFYSYIDGQDTSLITFHPDWKPDYFPIAPENYQYKYGHIAHSCGCDHGSEVAHYAVRLNTLTQDLVTDQNSPRPGRSGGGLMDDEGYYIGTCWGTQYVDGSGQGFFTPLTAIHRFWRQQTGYEFLLNQKVGGNARNIPVIDQTEEQGKYDPDYILLPGH